MGQDPGKIIRPSKTSSEADDEEGEKKMRCAPNLDTRGHGSDDEESNSDPNRGQENESQAQSLSEENASMESMAQDMAIYRAETSRIID